MKKNLCLVFLEATLVLPFVMQKAHLDATRAGLLPELANFASHLVFPSLLLPVVAIQFLPLAWQGRLAVIIVLMPTLILAFNIFTVVYACDNYGAYCPH